MLHGYRVVEEAVQDRRRQDLVAEDVAPLTVSLVGREHDGAALVAATHQLEEEVGGGTVEGEVAHLVDDEELGLAEGGQPQGAAGSGRCVPDSGSTLSVRH